MITEPCPGLVNGRYCCALDHGHAPGCVSRLGNRQRSRWSLRRRRA